MRGWDVDAVVGRVLGAGNFFVKRGGRIAVEAQDVEPVVWELYEGQLLDTAMARATVAMRSWVVQFARGEGDAAPVVVLRYDEAAGAVHVVREILSYVHETYTEAGREDVILTREVERNRAELVGTVRLAGRSEEAVEGALGEYVRMALAGTSRLPITSVETPHPAYSFGWSAYLGVGGRTEAWREPVELVRAAFDARGEGVGMERRAGWLEFALRAAEIDEVEGLVTATEEAVGKGQATVEALMAVVRQMFHGLALSPYTEFVDRLLRYLGGLAECDVVGPARVVDVVGYMVRQLVRHVTAFDLVTFHSFGANYPDALFLEVLLAWLVEAVRVEPGLFLEGDGARLRRRAVRQAVVARSEMEGLLVPDAPTSPGELVRVMPEEVGRVPTEQVTERGARRRRLFGEKTTEQVVESMCGTSEGAGVWRAAMEDLRLGRELLELGTATFLDRPWGRWKGAGAMDRTPLVSYEAVSKQVATRRLRALGRSGWLPDGEDAESLAAKWEVAVGWRFGADRLPGMERTGVIALEDMLRVAMDFKICRTTAGSVGRLWEGYDWSELRDADGELAEWLLDDGAMKLVVPAEVEGELWLVAFDREGEERCRLKPAGEVEYEEWAGVEWLAGGAIVSLPLAGSHRVPRSSAEVGGSA